MKTGLNIRENGCVFVVSAIRVFHVLEKRVSHV